MLSLDFGTILKIFFLILMGMLYGFIILTVNFQFLIEYMVTTCTLCWEKTYIRLLLINNLRVHRQRNSSTTLVYSLSISFLILCLVSYNLQSQNLLQYFEKEHNSIHIQNTGALQIKPLEEHFKIYEDVIEGFGYKSDRIGGVVPSFQRISPVSRISSIPINLVSVTPYLFEAFDKKFLEFQSEDESILSISERLYTNKGAHAMGIDAYSAEQLYLFPEHGLDSFNLIYQRSLNMPLNGFKIKPKFVLESASGIKMGKNKNWREEQNVIISIISAMAYTGISNTLEVNNLRFSDCFIKLKDTNDEKYTEFINGLYLFGVVSDLKFMKETLNEANFILNAIFNIIIALSMFM